MSTKIHDLLTEAGAVYDGRHVTNGSCEAQVKVVRDLLKEIKARISTEATFGRFDDSKTEEALAYPEAVAREIIDEVACEYGIIL